MDTHVLSLRMDSELFERLRGHAARRGMSVQDYVVRTMIRDDFDQRFQTAVEETEKFYGDEDGGAPGAGEVAEEPARDGAVNGAARPT
ncbi:hypothetical protein ACFU9O_13810 [Streptomyces albidoflavus]|jgi:hypothetical protein|uniref:Uncharacterized protein n=3 Tax=Streptomyces TaxID=1883 RepID=A0ACC7Y1Y1_9ACTN|nr:MULTISPECIES: hypothetical protein [Streptomyces]MYW58685.1 hypothetical protein [Streptomyces sp. SID8370]MYW88082.1 hypothetical protein [Streptomyces sp. SID8371]MYX51613.1 hypothetical protein [Streptomyces sp. SID8385]MYX86746.1 hypothetical protein [Streptomyces sp. SID4915]NUW08615.1 hypothetical protein [Streptomyces sp. CAI-21]NVI31779.1 hypothetical protein [Streptomyces sp. CAI-17]QLA57251.1 hypothetical protein HWN34_12155 [Streptomyces violascens]SCD81541.1 hypothetical prot